MARCLLSALTMKTRLTFAVLALITLVARDAGATDFSLWIHGYSALRVTSAGSYSDYVYFGPAERPAGVNKRAISWGGQDNLTNTVAYVRRGLDCYCTGSNWCYLAAHSTGEMHVGYLLSLYGASARNVKIPDTGDATGTCQNASGSPTQTGWNIRWIDVAGGGAGGSELAPIGHWVDKNTDDLVNLSHPILVDLDPARARTLYDHNQTRGVMFYMFAGAKGSLHSLTLPGQDDQIVAYHSAGSVSGDVQGWCNPWDAFCYGVLTMGTAAADAYWPYSDRAKWSNHYVQFRDDSESYMHLPYSTLVGMQDWGELVALERQDMVNYAW